MKLRIWIAVALTLILVRLAYGWRWLTFIVWTNAAILSHSHPHIAGVLIEGFLILFIYTLVLAIAKIITNDLILRRKDKP